MKVCSKCKVEKPKAEFNRNAKRKDGLRSECKGCMAAYKAANREKIAAQNAANYAANREKIAARAAAYRDANRGKIAAYGAARYEAKREKLAVQMSAYRVANREKIASQEAAWRKANPEKTAAQDRNRRARKRNADGRHSAADVRAIFEKQRGLCANCQTKLFKSGRQKFHVDHIMPLALGGSNWPANLQCLCKTCNLSKGAKDPIEWANQNGLLI